MRLTKAQKTALSWISEREPVARFPVGKPGPSPIMVKRLSNMGLIEIAGQESGVFGFKLFRLSQAGRASLGGE